MRWPVRWRLRPTRRSRRPGTARLCSPEHKCTPSAPELIVAQGVVELAASGSANLSVRVENGTLRLSVPQDLKSLDVDEAAGFADRIRLGWRAVGPHLSWRHGAGAVVDQATIDAVWADIAAGHAGGAWNGTGISASTIADPLTNGLGLVLAADAGDAEFLGIREMIMGDANGDDFVDSGSATVLFANLGSNGSWLSGDFNYDQFIDTGDATAPFAAVGRSFHADGSPRRPCPSRKA